MSEIDFPFATISYKEPVIYLLFKDGAELEPEHVRQIITASAELSNNKPYKLLSDARGYVQISSEARRISADRRESPLVIANAVLVNNMAVRITGTIFMNFNRPHFPFRLFDNEKKAMEWLLGLKT